MQFIVSFNNFIFYNKCNNVAYREFEMSIEKKRSL